MFNQLCFGLASTLSFVSLNMAALEELSLEETNKIRISLGLKPLTDDKAPPADKEKEAEQNYARVREQAGKERADRCFPVLLCNPYLDYRTDANLYRACRALRDKIAK